MIPLTKEEEKMHNKQEVCYICKNYFKVKEHCHYTEKYRGECKRLAKYFKGQSECLGENTEKYITFSVTIKKELDNGKSITYKITLVCLG